MGTTAPTVNAMLEAVRGLDGARDGLDGFVHRALEHLGAAVPFREFSVAVMDPGVQLPVRVISSPGLPPSMLGRVAENELLEPDYNKFVDLARAPEASGGVAVLGDMLDGRFRRSARHRVILQPLGLGPELRAVLRDGSRCWGTLCLLRDLGARDFTRADRLAVRRVAPMLATGIVRALASGAAAGRDGARERGVVMVAPDGTHTANAAAERLLAHIDPHAHAEGRLPAGIILGTVRVQAAHPEGDEPRTLRMHLPCDGRLVVAGIGRWMDGQTLVTLDPTPDSPYAELMVSVFGITDRQMEVARLVMSGYTDSEIARELVLAPKTVHKHVQAVREKVGARNRAGIAAALFTPPRAPANPPQATPGSPD